MWLVLAFYCFFALLSLYVFTFRRRRGLSPYTGWLGALWVFSAFLGGVFPVCLLLAYGVQFLLDLFK
jgi:hypothetical protein